MTLSPAEITALAAAAGAIVKHGIPSSKLNKAIPYIVTATGAALALGTTTDPAAQAAAEGLVGALADTPNGRTAVDIMAGAGLGLASSILHQFIVKKTPLRKIQIKLWWDHSEKQGL